MAIKHKIGGLLLVLPLFFTIPLEIRGAVPYWDQFPRIYQGVSASNATAYHANIAFNHAQTDPTWGTHYQKHQHDLARTTAAHAAGLKNISYFETFGQSVSFAAELGPWDEVNLTPVLHTHWNWEEYGGGTIQWLGVHDFFDDSDYARPYTRTHPVYGGPPMTYPDGSIATGYAGSSSDPRNSRVYDAGSAKDILGNISLTYTYNDAANQSGQTTGLLFVPETGKYASHISFNKDSAAPAWNDYTYASTRLATDAGMDGMWTDNFSPWDSFGNPPVKHAFGDWSVARFRDHLSSNFTPGQLASMGVSDVNTFDITTELSSTMQGFGGNSSDLDSAVWKDSRWVDEPLWRAYTIFKRQAGTEALTNYYNAAHQAAADSGVSDFMVAGNDIPGLSLGWARGDLDLVSTEWSADWGLSTGPQGVGLPAIGRSAPAYKLAREHAKSRFVSVWLYKDGFETELSQPNTSKTLYYEMLATHALPQFDPTNLLIAGTPTANIAFNTFVSQLEPDFGGRTAVEDVGIFYSSSSLLAQYTPGGFLDHANQPHQFGYYGWGTALGELHYQYRAVPEWKLDTQTLDGLRVLVIPSAEVFDSATVANVLTPWVQAGGRLIVTGDSGKRLGESENFDVNPGGYTLASLTGVTGIGSIPSQQLQNVGSGTVLYLQDNIGLDFYNASTTRPSLLPQFTSALSSVLSGSSPLALSANGVSSNVGLTVYEDNAAERLFVDANNFDINVSTDQITETGPVTFEVALPAWLDGMGVKLSTFSPEATSTATHRRVSPDRVEVTLDSVLYYTSTMLEVDLPGDSIYLFNAKAGGPLAGQWGLALNSGEALPTGPVTGGFTTFNDGALTSNPNKPLVGDVNGDGISDIVTVGKNSNQHTIFQARNSATIGRKSNLSSPQVGDAAFPDNWSPYFVINDFAQLLADVDGDGRDDAIIVRPNPADPTLTIWEANHSDANGLEGNTPATSFTGFGFDATHRPLVGDFNGDGAVDVAMQNQTNNFIIGQLSTPGTGLNTTNPSFSGSADSVVPANHIATLVGDINGDGMDDIVQIDDRSNNGTWVWVAGLTGINGGVPSGIEIGAGGVSWAFPFTLESTSVSATPLLADINHDGRDDLVLYEEYVDGGSGNIWGKLQVALSDDPAGGLFTTVLYATELYDYMTLFGVDGSGMIPLIGQAHILEVNSADFDGDTVVDGADFLTWQRGFGIGNGASNSQGDANGDGTVLTADLQVWQATFETVATAVAGTYAVPVPGNNLLVVIGLLVLQITQLCRGARC